MSFFRVELDGARGVGDGAVIVPLVVEGTGSPSVEFSVVGIEAYRLVVVRDGAVLTSTEARISGIEKRAIAKSGSTLAPTL